VRIRRLHINGFGVFHDADLAELSPGLTVIEGANGAGKSTFLEFIRALFFGYQTGRNARTYPPLAGGRHGGWTEVALEDGRLFRVERGPRAPGRAAGRVEVSGIGNEDAPLETLTGHASRQMFENVFAISLDALAAGSSLGQVQGQLYAAMEGLGAVQLPGALKQAGKEADDLFRKGGHVQPLAKQFQRLETVTAELKEVTEGSAEYEALLSEHQRLSERLEDLKEQCAVAETRKQHQQHLRDAWQNWLDLQRARQEIAELPETAAVPADAEAQLAALEAEIDRQEKALATLGRRQAQDAESLAQLHPDEALLAQTETVAALQRRLEHLRVARHDLPGVEVTARGQEEECERQLRDLGPEWTLERVEALDTSQATRRQAQQFAQELGREEEVAYHRRRVEDLERAAKAAAEAAKTAQQAFEVDYADEPPELAALEAGDEDLERLRLRLSIASRSADTILGLRTQREDLEADRQRLEAEAEIHTVPSWASLLVVALGLLSAVAAYLLISPFGGGLAAILAGIAALGIHAYRSRQLEGVEQQRRQREAQRQTLLDRLQNLEVDEHDYREAKRDADEQIARLAEAHDWRTGDESDAAAIARQLRRDRERRHDYDAARQRLVEAQRAAEAAEHELEAARERLQQSESAAAGRNEAWSAWLEEHDLPGDLQPNAMESFLTRVEALRELRRQHAETAARVKSIRQTIQAFLDDANRALTACGRPPATEETVIATVIELERDRAAAAEIQRQRAALIAAGEERAGDLEEAQTALGTAQEGVERLLTEAGAEDREALIQLCRDRERRQSLERRISELERLLEARSGPGAARDRFEEELAEHEDITSLEIRLSAAEEERAAARQAYDDTLHRHAETGRRIDDLQQGGRESHLLREREAARAEIADLGR